MWDLGDQCFAFLKPEGLPIESLSCRLGTMSATSDREHFTICSNGSGTQQLPGHMKHFDFHKVPSCAVWCSLGSRRITCCRASWMQFVLTLVVSRNNLLMAKFISSICILALVPCPVCYCRLQSKLSCPSDRQILNCFRS